MWYGTDARAMWTRKQIAPNVCVHKCLSKLMHSLVLSHLWTRQHLLKLFLRYTADRLKHLTVGRHILCIWFQPSFRYELISIFVDG